MPEGWGRAGVELGGTSGYRVGRGRCYRPWAVERRSVEPALPLRVPLHGTALRRVHALRMSSSGQRRWARRCLSLDIRGRIGQSSFCALRCVGSWPAGAGGRGRWSQRLSYLAVGMLW